MRNRSTTVDRRLDRDVWRQNQQERDAAFFTANPGWTPPKPKIVCAGCGRGPLDGALLRKVNGERRCEVCGAP